MSDTPHQRPRQAPEHDDSANRSTAPWVAAVVALVMVPVMAVALLGHYGKLGRSAAMGGDSQSEQAVAERLQRVGSVVVKPVAAGGGAPKTGEHVYQAQCSACHGTGNLGAPKFGDAAAWGPRIATGYQALVNSALKGKNAMPAQGGGALSDLEVARGVAYMANKAGAKFDEPKAPAGAASAADAPASK